MSLLSSTNNTTTLSPNVVFLLAAGAGLSVASIYYSQPMLGIMGDAFHAGVSDTGLVPTLTQVGYALGILLLAPLGDRHDRRQIIRVKGVLLALTLLLCGFSSSFPLLLLSSLAIGLAATVAQDIIPAAATLASDANRGKTVGTVMTGLLAGILLSRVFSGVVAEYFGWRSVYFLAAVGVLIITFAIGAVLPRFKPNTTLSYPALLRSLGKLWAEYPELRRAALAQGLLSVAFSAFWSTLAVMLAERYQLGSAVAGAFGLAGAAGALAAPLAGALADRHGPDYVTKIGAAMVVCSFALMFLLPLLSVPAQLALIALSAVGFDLGIQATLVAHQTIIYAINPAARSRLNAIMFTLVFIGMASGAALGSKILESAGWTGVIALATVVATGGLVLRMLAKTPSRAAA
ncbi:Inner membrane transport protein ynfM [Serratia grimesii]|jgi:predicted MFS family arabinose efflux permease|uniref:MFS transporter n=1 Tax=Serratia grimesii TaxID=82995 RepID=UPI00077C84CB|nr:MFS transporter [Serratia grimesii]CAI1178174.1 Inner membrane transport protein ynfM [Serratia grimesii]CAI1589899.1 Inner membrane transport protein ynfM [Serratia grimesii]CAI2431223.1 Inner membrane transport protein ynfM [Serratia grimesii]CAI2790517.1 Inner membrane transport protein ynfM [Serratia grimesii]SUI33917.1 Inner membrane transport protein ynfM [Serratia grimesii]